MAAFVKVVEKALQRVASKASAKYILLLKLLRWWLGLDVPSQRSMSGDLKFLGTLALMISSVNESFPPKGFSSQSASHSYFVDQLPASGAFLLALFVVSPLFVTLILLPFVVQPRVLTVLIDLPGHELGPGSWLYKGSPHSRDGGFQNGSSLGGNFPKFLSREALEGVMVEEEAQWPGLLAELLAQIQIPCSRLHAGSLPLSNGEFQVPDTGANVSKVT